MWTLNKQSSFRKLWSSSDWISNSKSGRVLKETVLFRISLDDIRSRVGLNKDNHTSITLIDDWTPTPDHRYLTLSIQNILQCSVISDQRGVTGKLKFQSYPMCDSPILEEDSNLMCYWPNPTFDVAQQLCHVRVADFEFLSMGPRVCI